MSRNYALSIAEELPGQSLVKVGFPSNTALPAAVLLTFVLQMAVVYVSYLQNLFKADAPSVGELLLSLVLSIVVFWGVEPEKWLVRRREVLP